MNPWLACSIRVERIVVSVESSSISKPGWRSFTTTTWLLLVFTVMPSNPLLSGGSGKRCAIVS